MESSLDLVDADLEPGDLAFLRAGGGVARTLEQYTFISTGWDVAPIGVAPYASTIRSWRGHRVFTVECTGTPMMARRRAHHLHIYTGWAQFSIPLVGSARIDRGAHSVSVATGEIGVISFGEEFTLSSEHGSEVLLLYIPAKLLSSRGIELGPLAGRVLSGGPMVPALTTLLKELLAQRCEPGSWGTETALLELVFSILFDHEGRGTPDDHLRERARALIHRRFADPTLIADTLALELGVSRRRLYSVMENQGVSIAGLIRMRRLTHAQILLRTRPDISIAHMAILCGFRGIDQFTRSFRTVIGVSPSMFRTALAKDAEADG